jgi:hypothetical protein
VGIIGWVDKQCETCGKDFRARPAAVRAGYGRYCSRTCASVARRTVAARSCEICGATFAPRPAHVAKGWGRFCSMKCQGLSRRRVHRKAGLRYRKEKAIGHPIAPKSGNLAVARRMLYDEIGPGPHPCHWCNKAVDWNPGKGVSDVTTLLVDHLDHDPTNDVIENLVPSCNHCNAHRRTPGKRVSPVIQPGELFVINSGNRARAVQRTCETCGGTFIARVAAVKVGQARFCSRSCARRAPRKRG